MHTIHYKTKIKHTEKDNIQIEWVDDINVEEVDTKKEYIKRKRYYYKRVKELTKLVNKESISGYNINNLLTFADIVNGIHSFKTSSKLVIDHKIAIIYGFNNNIPAEYIADVTNLRYIPSNENQLKLSTNYIDDLNEWILKQKNIL
jgi:hypothetical protein